MSNSVLKSIIRRQLVAAADAAVKEEKADLTEEQAEALRSAIIALPDMADILYRIFRAHSTPKGASCGEARLCKSYADLAEDALVAAGYTLSF